MDLKDEQDRSTDAGNANSSELYGFHGYVGRDLAFNGAKIGEQD